MSIFATNYIIDKQTGEVRLVKRLNKIRIDRWSAFGKVGGWNKSGKKARIKKRWNQTYGYPQRNKIEY